MNRFHHLVPRIPFQPDESALLVTDMQRFFLEGGSHAVVLEPEATIDAANELIDLFRSKGRPIIFTRHGYAQGEDIGVMSRWWNDNLMLSEERSEIDPRVHLTSNDKVVVKKRYSAFALTELEDLITVESQLVICGVMTHLCVESTAREAFHRDYEVFVVREAVSTNSKAFQESALDIMDHGFADVVGLDHIKEVMG